MKINKISTVLICCLAFHLIFSLSSCNDSPADVGLITDTLDVKSISSNEAELIVSTGTEKGDRNSAVGTSITHIGISGEIKAYTFIRYNEATIPDTLDYLTADDIESANLSFFQGSYGFGDLESRNVDFDIFSLNRGIRSNTTYEDLFSGGEAAIKDDFIANYQFQAVDYSTTFSLDEQLIPFEKNTIIDWLDFRKTQKQYFDSTIAYSSEISSTLSEGELNSIADFFGHDRERSEYINQIGLFPNQNSNIIVRSLNDTPFNIEDASYRSPIITVAYRNQESILDTFYILPARTSYFVNNIEANESGFSSQGVLSHRAFVELDLSSIPQQATIHRAEFELTIDRENSVIGSDGIDSVIVTSVATRDNDIGLTVGLRSQGIKLDSNDVVYFPIMADLVKAIRLQEDFNTFKFIMTPNGNLIDETFYFDRLTFYGLDATDPKKRPKLKIIYSTWED